VRPSDGLLRDPALDVCERRRARLIAPCVRELRLRHTSSIGGSSERDETALTATP
jgi:hypothetical protein